jgi:hypothetical protein
MDIELAVLLRDRSIDSINVIRQRGNYEGECGVNITRWAWKPFVL